MTDSLNQRDKQQTSLGGIKKTEIGLKKMRENSSDKLIIDSIRNKSEFLDDAINRNLDSILLSEIKLDD